MAKIHHLPPLAVIKGLRGVLDFYLWRGIPCVRTWPHIAPANRSPAAVVSAALFGSIILGYGLLGGALKTLFAQDAADQPRTGRDLYISAVLGHLHEAGMGDFLDLLTEATAYLQTLTGLVDALASSGLDQIDVNVLATVLAADASTQTTLAELTARIGDEVGPGAGSANQQLSVIKGYLDTLRQTVDGWVGGPQLQQVVRVNASSLPTGAATAAKQIGWSDILSELKFTLNAAAGDNTLVSTPVPEGEIWKVTIASCCNNDKITTRSHIYASINGATIPILETIQTVAGRWTPWAGETFLVYGDTLACLITGCDAGNDLYFGYAGHKLLV